MSEELKKIRGEQPRIELLNKEEFPNIVEHFSYLYRELEKFGAKNPEIIDKIGPHIENAKKLATSAIETLKESKGEIGKLEAEIEVGNLLANNLKKYELEKEELDKKPVELAFA